MIHLFLLFILSATCHTVPCAPTTQLGEARQGGSTAESLLLLKTRRTGSTWLASLAAQEESTLVLHELFRPRDAVQGVESIRDKVRSVSDTFHRRALNETLLAPPDSGTRHEFDARTFLESESVCAHVHRVDGGIACRSVLMSMNPAAAGDVVGLAPLWLEDTAAAGLTAPVVLFRTNLVKHAIAVHRGRCMRHRCGQSNAFRTDDGQVRCTVEEKSRLDVRTLKCLVARQFEVSDTLREQACTLAAATGQTPYGVTYEGLQQAPIATLDELYRTLLGRPFVPSDQFADDKLVEKTTPEALADVLVDADTLLVAFEAVAGHSAAENASLACLRRMFTSPDATEFAIPSRDNEQCRPPESWMRLAQDKPSCDFPQEWNDNSTGVCYANVVTWQDHVRARRSVEIWLVVWGIFCLGIVQLQRRRPMLLRSITGKLDTRFHGD